MIPNQRLVTGHAGFVGGHALAMWPGICRGLLSAGQPVDICDRLAVLRALKEGVPQTVLHLAGISFVPQSFDEPEKTYATNFLGTLNLLEALAEVGFKGRFLYVSSGDAYGLVQESELPLKESATLKPRSPYAVSKAAAEALCYQWSQTGPFEVIIARPFNHLGSGQAPYFAVSDFARQIAEIAAGRRQPELHVGNIDVTRDFTDVRDVVRAYDLLLTHGKNGETYNVCSGVERSVRSLIERLLTLANVQAAIVTDPSRVRHHEQLRMVGCHEKLSRDTLWQPSLALNDTLLTLYHYWEQKIAE